MLRECYFCITDLVMISFRYCAENAAEIPRKYRGQTAENTAGNPQVSYAKRSVYNTWPEIQDALQPGQTAADCPDVVVRAFYAKQTQMIKDIKAGMFGKAIAYLFTIELQKCGLPHMHCIIFLDEQSKLHTPE